MKSFLISIPILIFCLKNYIYYLLADANFINYISSAFSLNSVLFAVASVEFHTDGSGGNQNRSSSNNRQSQLPSEINADNNGSDRADSAVH